MGPGHKVAHKVGIYKLLQLIDWHQQKNPSQTKTIVLYLANKVCTITMSYSEAP